MLKNTGGINVIFMYFLEGLKEERLKPPRGRNVVMNDSAYQYTELSFVVYFLYSALNVVCTLQ